VGVAIDVTLIRDFVFFGDWLGTAPLEEGGFNLRAIGMVAKTTYFRE
jgi:hypothetical protein